MTASDVSGLATSATTDTTNASNISSGTLALARGGTGSNLSATGGTGQFLKQTSSGAVVTVGTIQTSDVPTLNQNTTGTAAGFAANPANCSAGTLPRGVDAGGVAEGCAAVALASEVTGALPNANLAAMASKTFKANVTGSTAAPTDATAAQMRDAMSVTKTFDASNATYGAVADAKISASGACTSGSATFTDSSGSFSAGDVGKSIKIEGCEAGSATGRGTGAITSISNSGGNAVLNFTVGTFGASPASGYYVWYSKSTGALDYGDYYIGTLTGTCTAGNTCSAPVYTDAALTSPVAYSATGTGSMEWAVRNLITTISAYTSATSVTLATTAKKTQATAQYSYGTLNQTAIGAAITAASAAGGGTVLVPAGAYMISGTNGAPVPTLAALSNCTGLQIPANVRLVGDGMGKTVFYVLNERFPVICMVGDDAQAAHFTIKSYPRMLQIMGNIYMHIGILSTSFCSGTINRNNIGNIEAIGIIALSNVSNGSNYATVHDNRIHDSWGGMVVSTSGACETTNATVHDNYVWSVIDTGYSYNSTTFQGSSKLKYLFSHHNTYANSTANGWELNGGDSLFIDSETAIDTYGMGIRVKVEPGYAQNNNVKITNMRCYGAGAGPSPTLITGLGSIQGSCVDLYYESAATGTSNNITVDGVFIAPSASGTAHVGTGVCISPANAASFFTNVTISNVTMYGGSSGATSTSAATLRCTRGAGIETAGSGTITNLKIGPYQLVGTYKDGIYVGSNVLGIVDIASGNIVNPNASAAGSVYAIQVLGGSQATYPVVNVSGGTSLAGIVNYAPASATTIACTFSTAGGFSNGNINTQSGNSACGKTWTVNTGTISVNTGTSTLGSSATPANTTINLGAKNADVTAVLATAPGAANRAYIVLGANSGATTQYHVDLYNLQVSPIVGGAAVEFGAFKVNLAAAQTTANNDTVRAVLNNTRLMVYKNGTLVSDLTVPAMENVYTGLLWANTTPTITSFSVR